MIITVTSQKGGVGKSTTAVTLAAGLARQNIGTLLVDLDPQGHAALAMGQDQESGIYNLMVKEQPLDNCHRRLPPLNFWLLPGDSRTKTVETLMRNDANVDQYVRQMLQMLGSEFDAVVFDTAASGVLQEVAMQVADVVVMPCRTEALAVDGVEQNLLVLHKLRPNFGGYYILPVAYEERLREHRYQLGQLRANYAGAVLEPVPARTAVAEAQAYGKTIWEYNRDGSEDVRAAYSHLIDILLGKQ